jgi:hypothetical protein
MHRLHQPPPSSALFLFFSKEKLHTVGWALSKLIELPFEWKGPTEVNLPKIGLSAHDSLVAYDENLEIDAFLILNRGSNGFLLSTRPQFDFLLLLRGENAPALADEWKEELKKQAWWDLCYPLEKERHSSLAHVLYL